MKYYIQEYDRATKIFKNSYVVFADAEQSAIRQVTKNKFRASRSKTTTSKMFITRTEKFLIRESDEQ